MSPRAGAAWLAGALVAAGLALVPGARADGDPASDVLITATVFAPYAPKVSPPLLERLAGLAESARRQHHPVRVAMIASPDDLGAYPMLFGRPQRYAELLAAELRFVYRGTVLVVMPEGFGVANAPRRALGGLRVGRGGTGDADVLVRSAEQAMQRLAAAEGVTLRVEAPPAPRGTATVHGGAPAPPGDDGLSPIALVGIGAGVGLVGLALAGGGFLLWRRRVVG